MERCVISMFKFILKLCFLPILLPLWILGSVLKLLGLIAIGVAIDALIFGQG